MKRTPAIPVVTGLPEPQASILQALKQNAEFTAGIGATKIAKLGPTSQLADLINKVNDLIDRLQGEK